MRALQLDPDLPEVGDHNAAFAHLDQACAEREGWMPSVATFPMFDPLHDDARFAALLTRIGLRPASGQ